MPLVSLIQPLTTFLEQFDFMLTWQHKQEGFIVCLETSQRTASKRSKASNLRPTLHPWNSTRLATPNAYQLIALCLCNKLTRYGSPLKKVAGLMGLVCYPLEHFFKYFHWFLSGNPRVRSMRGTGLFCDATGTSTSKRLSTHLGISEL